MPSPIQSSAEPLTDPLVTGIHDRWDEQGLTGGPWPFMAICSVSRLNQILAKALDAELRRFDLSRTGYFLLTTLALITGGRARLNTLGRLVMLHPTTVKLTVDQLETAGLVTRRRHPQDRRATLVQITPAGIERVGSAAEALESAEGPLGWLGELDQDIFKALQPARLAAGDLEF